MLELLLLGDVLDTYTNDKLVGTIEIEGSNYDLNKILDRYRTLLQEFLSPYVIDKNSKE